MACEKASQKKASWYCHSKIEQDFLLRSIAIQFLLFNFNMNPSWGNNQNFRIGTFFGFVKQFATKFTQRFGVDFPIVGSPMTLSITTPKFVSSVGSTGCLSFIGTGDIVNSDVSRIPVGVIQNDYKKAKSLAGLDLLDPRTIGRCSRATIVTESAFLPSSECQPPSSIAFPSIHASCSL